MSKSLVKEIVRLAAFMVAAIWAGMLMLVGFMATLFSAEQPKAIWVALAAAMLLIGTLCIMNRVWRWK